MKYISIITVCTLILSISLSCKTIIANALTGEGSSTVFTGDSDPKLVGEALPFAMKIYETLLDGNPKHRGLLLFTGSLFVMYANAFVQGPAEMLPSNEWKLKENELERARNLYLRGLDMLYRGLEVKHKGFIEAAELAATDTEAFETMLKKCKKDDVSFLYWAAAGGMAAYSTNTFDFDLNARIPEWKAMALRAYELNPDFDGASLDEFLFILYGSIPVERGGNPELAMEFYQRAMDKTAGRSASALITRAEMISASDVTEEGYELFKECLEKVIAINPDEDISSRLVTIINQKRAQWLLDNAYMYFSFIPFPDNY